jgi:tetratricopeptide (TPR) repeat protein
VAINREKVLEAAQKFYEKKKYDKALFEYQKVIQEDPNDARILLKVGDLQSKMELYADAVATYEKVGKFYAAQGFALKAIAVYKQIRELIAKHVPNLEERYGHIAPKLAELYQQLGLVSDALAALDEVATRLQRQGKDAEAIETFRRVVELDPTNPLPHLRLAEALSRGQDVEGAVTEFSVAAGLLVNLGRRDDALKVYERLLHHRLDADKARKAAELYLSRGQPNDGMQALAKLQICFQADPKNLDTLQLLAHAFFAIGQASKAIEVQKEMARIARDSGDTALFASIVNRLRQQAPNDETVVRMVAATNLHAQTAPVGFEARVNQPPPPVPAARAMATAPMNVPGPFGNAPQPPPHQGNPINQTFAQVPPQIRPPTMSAPEVHEVSYASVPPEELEEIEGYEDEVAEAQRLQDEHDLAHAREQREMEAQQPRLSPSMPPPSPETLARIAQILADAASFRRVRLYKKAIDTLNGGLELDPRSLELYETLRQVLYEARQEDQSIDVGLKLAALYVDALDGESAARVLQDVLALDPNHPRALEMLHELGYELAPEEEEPELVGDVTDAIQLPPGIEDYGEPHSDPSHGALPSYDLEEMGPRDVSQRYDQQRRVSGRTREHASGGFDAVDDPFLSEAPLPSFPLDQPTGELDTFEGQDSAPHYGAQQEQTAHTANTAFPAPASQSVEALEDALEEADFFASRGLFADARTILHDQLARHPHHPLLLERMAELDESEAAAGGEGGDGYALSLDDLEAPPAGGVGGFSSATQQVDVEEVFSKFKEGVARQISIDDAQSHYDLGVAYKEMGLIDDAIREFETAARDESRETVCLSMVGMIELERGNVEQALEAFLRGVNSRGRQPDQEMVLCFEIGACYELQNMNSEALGYYQRVLRRDPRYRDVEARVRRLSSAGAHDQSQVLRASGGDEDFERAFEDLLDEG